MPSVDSSFDIFGQPIGGDTCVIQEALSAIRTHLDMEVAYFSEFVDGRTIFRRVDAPGLEHLIKEGDSQSLDDVYCNHILEGRLPELIPDTSQFPLAVSMPITQAVPIGSHASIPIRRADGTPYGMFCCLSPRPNLSLNTRDLDVLRMFADIAAKQVNTELEHNRSKREIYAHRLGNRRTRLRHRLPADLRSLDRCSGVVRSLVAVFRAAVSIPRPVVQ